MINLKSSGRMITNKLQDVTAVEMKRTEKRNNLHSKMQITNAPPRSSKKRNKRIPTTATQLNFN
tara:strand:- start:419 stop:610 length:192 start_codon:yes stop_codon:yes gene_type:complete